MNKIKKSPSLLGNRDLMRAMNRSTVLYIIKTYGPIARAEVARHCGLSPASVSGITAELINEDIIYEKDVGHSVGGRRPILLAINPSGRFVVGIKLTETKVIGALTDLEATVIVKKTNKVRGTAAEAVSKQISQLTTELLQEAEIPKKKLLGVGVGLAGIVNSEQGILRESPFYGWKELPLRNMLQNLLHTPVYIDNDVNTLTLAEKWFGLGQEIDDFIVITIGRGIGMGIVTRGQFYRGAKGGAGELGHIVINPEGSICECGKRGCLETYVGDHGLLRMANEKVEQGEIQQPVKTVEELLRLAEKGSEGAKSVYRNAGDVLGQSIANLINIFNPGKIIISGEGIIAGELIFAPMRDSITKYVLPGLANDTDIQIDVWDDYAWARGAASLVLRELYESPIHHERVDVGT